MSSKVSFFLYVGLLITVGGGGFMYYFVFKIIGISRLATTGFGISRTRGEEPFSFDACISKSSATSSTKRMSRHTGSNFFLLFFPL